MFALLADDPRRTDEWGRLMQLTIEEIREQYLKQCGPCDFGLFQFPCQCPEGDPRWVIQMLCDEVDRLRTQALD